MSTDFYADGGLNAATYDLRLKADDRAIRGDVAFFLNWARTLGGPVLDLGCGTGRISHALSDAGIQVTGLDQSEGMLSQARRKGSGPTFVRGDMTEFKLSERFGLAIAPFRSFQALLTADDQTSCLECVRRHLRPGGRLILTLFDPKLGLIDPENPWTPEPTTVPLPDGQMVIEVLEHRPDPFTQTLRSHWRFRQLDASGQQQRSEDEVLRMRWTFRSEMRYLLKLSGFMPEHEFSDYQGGPPRYAGEQIWIARRVE